VEFGCGCGNLARPLARAGFHVVAIDCNPFAINYLTSVAPANLRAMQGNFESVRLGRKFDIAMLKSCVLNTIDSESRRRFFATARASLRRGGAVAVEIYQPRWLESGGKFGNDAQDFVFEPIDEMTCRIKADYYCGDVVYELNTTAEILRTEDLARLAIDNGFTGLRERITLNPLSDVLVFE
jgi:2-polyprenyl-3-methyl-5-hydroxy-6-metoxy-1,4-benzoquinol methylase